MKSANSALDAAEDCLMVESVSGPTPKIVPMDKDSTLLPADFGRPSRARHARAGGLLAQCLVATAVVLLSTGAGCPLGFSGILVPQLQHPNSTLQTDNEMASWIVSLHSVSTLPGTLLSGPLMDRLGRNRALQAATPVMVAGWAFLGLAQNHAMVLVARFLCGFAVGLVIAPSQVFLGETAEPRIRGLLVGAPYMSYSIGILYVYLAGSFLSYRYVSALAAIPVILGAVWLHFLPESPVWLVRSDRLKSAQESLDFLRGGAIGGQAKVEMEQLVSRAAAEKAASANKKASVWRLFLEPFVVKPIVIMNVYNLLMCLTGTFIVIFYATDLANAVLPPSMDAQLVANLTAVVRLIVCGLGCTMLQRVGIRAVAIISALGAAISTALLACVVRFDWGDSEGYAASALMLLYVALSSFGMFIMPGTMISELLPTSVRSLASAVSISILNFSFFAYAKMYPFMKEALGSAGLLWLFSAASLANMVWTFLLMPETKGRTLNDIEDYFRTGGWLWHRKPRRTLVSTVADD